MPVEDKPTRSRRMERRDERMKMARKLTEVKRVRVSPATEQLRKSIRHPRFGGFRSSGSVEWPLDNFVRRRIKEGSVVLETAAQTQERQQTRQAESSPGTA